MKTSCLNSWLVFLDINYLSDDAAVMLCDLDINNVDHQLLIIETAMARAVFSASDEHLNSIRPVLDEVPFFPESEVRALIADTETPFEKPLEDYKQFFNRVRQHFFS